MTETMIEERLPRTLIGKIVKWCFILFNILMIFWLIAGFNSASESVGELTSEAEQLGATIGTGIGAMLIMFIWVVGIIILTPILMLTRGKKTYKKIKDDS